MSLRRKNVSVETGKLGDHEMLLNTRTRFSAAELTTTPGAIFLPAQSRGKYRLVEAVMIANGGAAGGATSINLVGVQNGARVALMTALVAGLTQSTMLHMGDANAAVLANGGSTNLNDSNTAIFVERVGAALTGATSIDVIATYALEMASMISGA